MLKGTNLAPPIPGNEAHVAIKMQRYPQDPRRWETLEFLVETATQSWNGYVDDLSGALTLKGGRELAN
jgi:hypothetical protein